VRSEMKKSHQKEERSKRTKMTKEELGQYFLINISQPTLWMVRMRYLE